MSIGDVHRLYYAAALKAPFDTASLAWMLAADSVILRMRAVVYHHNPDMEGTDGVTAQACQSAAYALSRLVEALCATVRLSHEGAAT
jgi:hypothetical protein